MTQPPSNRHHPPGNRRQLDADGHVQTNSVSAAPAFFADFQHAARRSRQNKVVTCPNQTRKNTTCASCMLCQRGDRSVIVGFRAHGSRAKKAEAIANS